MVSHSRCILRRFIPEDLDISFVQGLPQWRWSRPKRPLQLLLCHHEVALRSYTTLTLQAEGYTYITGKKDVTDHYRSDQQSKRPGEMNIASGCLMFIWTYHLLCNGVVEGIVPYI